MDDVTYYTEANIAGVLLGPHAAFSVLATVLLCARVYTGRYVTRADWALDEYVAIVALIANNIMLIAEGIASTYGLGSNMVAIATSFPHGTAGFLKCIMALEIAYGIACPLSKLAVLAMYYRIFSTSPMIRYSVWIMASMIGGWGIAVVIVSIFSCTPIEGFWDSTVAEYCINSTNFYISITVPNIVFDVLTTALPIREVWKLQMHKERKMAITGVFLLGGSVVLASVTRLILFTIYLPGVGPTGNNISQTVVIPHTASAVETCLAIIGACLPPCAPLFRRYLGGLFSSVASGYRHKPSDANTPSKNFNTVITIGKISDKGAPNSKRNGDRTDNGSFELLDDDASLQGSTDDLYVNGRGRMGNQDVEAPGGIRVKHDIRVEHGGTTTRADMRQTVLGGIPLSDISRR
ncbi:hypothetical protein F5Y15DRAFT_371304 [Xylariaceae sp. FL0016]|nr:hypothetical protein F5Y15DRAFT_371304 [Xylariaceae sp. FL0016]